nr:MAG TPA: Roquin II domain [Herelleviridae sp.]
MRSVRNPRGSSKLLRGLRVCPDRWAQRGWAVLYGK